MMVSRETRENVNSVNTMTGNDDPLLRELTVREENSLTVADLVDYATDHPERASRITRLLGTVLERMAGLENPTAETDSLVQFIRQYPEEATDLFGQIDRLTKHTDEEVRQGALRSLNCLSIVAPVDCEYASNVQADRLSDESTQIRRTALRGLAKLSLVAPEVVISHRPKLVRALESAQIPDTAQVPCRILATVSLAGSANIVTDLNEYKPEVLLADRASKLEAAAWAIQQCGSNCEIQIDTELDHDLSNPRALIDPLVSELQKKAQTNGGDLGVGATLALGLVSPHSRTQLWEHCEQKSDRRAHAAKWILDSEYSEDIGFNGESDITLLVASGENYVSGTDVSLPYEVGNQRNESLPRTGFTVSIQGQYRSCAGVRGHHPDEQTIKMSRCMRENLGVDIGEAVSITPHTEVPAESVEVQLPSDAPVSVGSPRTKRRHSEHDSENQLDEMTIAELREELTMERFHEGNLVGIDILLNVSESSDAENKFHFRKLDRTYGEGHCTTLPLRIASLEPARATILTRRTTIDVTRTDSLSFNEWHDLETVESIAPYVRLLKNGKHDDKEHPLRLSEAEKERIKARSDQ
jgi:hypothetical protein